jgi:hypothetical protein
MLNVIRMNHQEHGATPAEAHDVAVPAPGIHERPNIVALEVRQATQENVPARAGSRARAYACGHGCASVTTRRALTE